MYVYNHAYYIYIYTLPYMKSYPPTRPSLRGSHVSLKLGTLELGNPSSNGDGHVQLSCPMPIYWHSTLFSISMTTVITYKNCSCLLLLYGRINKLTSSCDLILAHGNLHG